MRAAEGRRAREPGHRGGDFGPQAEGLYHVGHHAEVGVLPQLGVEVPKRPFSLLFGDRTNPGHHRLQRTRRPRPQKLYPAPPASPFGCPAAFLTVPGRALPCPPRLCVANY
jgi:hypothetical protein